jgi:hypothetical protein
LTLAWDAVTLACNGSPEVSAVAYRIAVGLVAMGFGWQTESPAPNVVTPPAYVETVSETTYTTGDPAAGECVMVEVTAADQAGNTDDQPCGS